MQGKKRIELVIFSVISLFLIAACGQEEVIGGKTSPFLGGSEGLEIEFLPGSPPDEITDGDGEIATFPFQAVVSLTNKGEFDLFSSDVEIDLVGFFPNDFRAVATAGDDGDFADTDLDEQNPMGNPTARKKDSEGNIIEAVEVFKTFPKNDKLFKFKGDLKGNTLHVFRANVCYKYGTDAISELCVLENMIDVADDAICNPRGSKPVASSASPVQIISFRQSVAGPTKIQFSFDIVHKGNGDIFDVGGKDDVTGDDVDCPSRARERRSKEDKVRVTVDTGLTADNILKCVGNFVDTPGATSSSDQGTIKLVDGKRTVTCTQNLISVADFINPIDITLDFNYLDSVQKDILVKHLS